MTKDVERIAILETKMNTLEKEYDSWNMLIKSIIIRSFIWMGGLVISGIIFGWHLPENMRKTIAEWVSK